MAHFMLSRQQRSRLQKKFVDIELAQVVRDMIIKFALHSDDVKPSVFQEEILPKITPSQRTPNVSKQNPAIRY
jgi:hypothetical protein